jgi:hypothetical protein
MRSLLALLAVLCLPSTAAGSVRIVSAAPAGPAVQGVTVDIVVETDVPVDGARLTFPDLQGGFAATMCALRGEPQARRMVLPYRPAWPGVHSVLVTVTTGACGRHLESAWRLVEFEAAAPPLATAAAAAAGCPDASAPPVPRSMRAARLAVLCLLNAERSRRGLPLLEPDERLRRVASRSAHRPARPVRRGEQRAVTPGSTPEAAVSAWLANEAHARDLLDPTVRRVGAAVVARFPEPMRRPETTYVVELA